MTGVRRWALLIEYDGTPFRGWQVQENALTVQGVLEAAAARLSGRAVSSVAAGRTDSGVHAEGQVAQLDLPDDDRPGGRLDARRLRDALNFHMKPHPVVVLRAAPVAPDWNARFSAIGRRYRYRILERAARPALLLDRVWHVRNELDVDAMAAAAASLLGRHDFSSFRASSCQASGPVRTLDRLEVVRTGELVEIRAAARSFLHHQVRNMVGTLKLVGEKRWPVERVRAALEARNRAAAGPTAPPEGLCLVGVGYDPDPFATADPGAVPAADAVTAPPAATPCPR